MMDASFFLMTGTPPIWDDGWRQRSSRPSRPRKHRSVAEMVHQRIGGYEAFGDYMRAVFDRTEAWAGCTRRERATGWSSAAAPRADRQHVQRPCGRPTGITLLDAAECWIYQHGLRHMGEIELARAWSASRA